MRGARIVSKRKCGAKPRGLWRGQLHFCRNKKRRNQLNPFAIGLRMG